MRKIYCLILLLFIHFTFAQIWNNLPLVSVGNSQVGVSKLPYNPENPPGEPFPEEPFPEQLIEDPKYHDTQGQIDVSGAGELNFNLPIALPPGIKSVAPQVNLIYSGNSLSGIAGIGWNISGLSNISRISKNIEKDGRVIGLKYDYSDVYQFNGKRLLLISGEYGKDGAIYTTQEFSNVKIKSLGNVTTDFEGPSSWEVNFEDGSMAIYGAVLGTYNRHEYNITKWVDVNGNYITYNYVTENNTARIDNIQWGANDVLHSGHFNKITFVYKTRNVKHFAYANGVKSVQDKILDFVTVHTGNTLFRKYAISYTLPSNGAPHEILNKITESVTGSEARPVLFTRESSEDFLINASVADFGVNTLGDNRIIGDFDGDGKIDILRYITTMNPNSYTTLRLSGLDTNYGTYLNVHPENLTHKALTANLLSQDGKTKQKSALVKYSESTEPLSTRKLTLKTYFLENNLMQLEYSKEIASNTYNFTYESPQTGPLAPYYKDIQTLTNVKEMDINSDGISELVLTVVRHVSRHNVYIPNCNNGPSTELKPMCYTTENDPPSYSYFVVNPHPNNTDSIYNLGLSTDIDIFSDGKFTDVDGDGLQEISFFQNNTLVVYGFKPSIITNQYEFDIKTSFTKSIDGDISGAIFSDMNNDGKTDILVPQPAQYNSGNFQYYGGWYTYLSNGKSINNATYSLQFGPYLPKRLNLGNKQLNKFEFYYSNDINRDGLIDFVKVKSWIWQPGSGDDGDSSYGIEIYENRGMGSDGNISYVKTYDVQAQDNDNCSSCSTWKEMYEPMVGSMRIDNAENFLLLTHGPQILRFRYYDQTERSRIKSIEQGRLVTEINYKALDTRVDASFYSAENNLLYPYTELDKLPQTKVVSRLIQEGNFQDFRYRGLISHAQGRGLIGFRQTARSNWYRQGLTTPIWNGVQIDPILNGLPVKQWATKHSNDIFPTNLDISNNTLITFVSTSYLQTNIGGREIKMPEYKVEKDFLTDKKKETLTTYDQTYYLPTKIIVKYDNNFAKTESNLEYYHNPSGIGNFYYIGRPKQKSEAITAYGDTKNSVEEYIYNGNELKFSRSFAQNLSDYWEEEFQYDIWGNILEKKVSNSGLTQTIKSSYDITGRFVEKKTDNLGLETQYIFNNIGLLTTQTDSYNNTITNNYDVWGKLIGSVSSLGGSTTFVHKKYTNGDYSHKTVSPDGNELITYTDKKGQNYKSITKSYNVNQYIAVSTIYDAVGRKQSVSEPYFENDTPLHWSTIAYDELSRPITNSLFTGKELTTVYNGKTVTVTESTGRFKKKTADALGNIVQSEDNGGKILYKYNAVGQQIKIIYGANTIETTYDIWGRKETYHDPSNGLYAYEYDKLGKIITESSPKGKKEYIYFANSLLKKIIETSNDGISTNKSINFEYNLHGQIISKNGTANNRSFSNTYTYDSYGRLIDQQEDFESKRFYKRNIQYDAINRIIEYKQGLAASNVTEVNIVNEYNVWNGALKSIAQKNSLVKLWELIETNDKGQNILATLGQINVTNIFDSNGFLSKILHKDQQNNIIVDNDYEFNAVKNELNYRKNNVLNIEETFKYDEDNIPLNRLTSWTDPVTGQDHGNEYDEKGRIMTNKQVGDIRYESPTSEYRATSVDLNNAGAENYELNGANVLLQAITYNENNDPVKIDGTHHDYQFDYGLSESRQIMYYGGNFDEVGTARYRKYYSEAGDSEIIYDRETGNEKHILYIGGSAYESSIAFIKTFHPQHGSKTDGNFIFLHKDYIGNIIAITDHQGAALERRHFDAWGNFTHLKVGNQAVIIGIKEISDYAIDTGLVIDRGYTSHEHLFGVRLIHMNGRLYDPLLRRFLNADENIQDTENSQNYNKYGYVLNNPLMFNDPSGEFIQIGIGAAILIGAIIGGTGYTLGVFISTGSLRQWNVFDFSKSVIIGGISGAVTSGIGTLFQPCGLFANVGQFAQYAIQAGLHGTSQGFFSMVNGGSGFLQGFVSGAVGSIAGSYWMEGFGKGGAAMVAFGALSGGVGAELTGGNFFKGFLHGGVVALLNHEAHRPKSTFNVYDADNQKVGVIKVKFYELYTNPENGEKGLYIELQFTSSSKKYSDYLWIQTVTTNDPPYGRSPIYNDRLHPLENSNRPFYYSKDDYIKESWIKQGNNYTFRDIPTRARLSTTIGWRAELSLVGLNKTGAHALHTLYYGFNLYSSGHSIKMPLLTIPYHGMYKWLKR